MSATAATGDLTAPLLTDRFFAGDPHPHLARLRREAPVARNDELGCWFLSRHADVVAASTDPATFCSSEGILLFEIGVEYPTPPTMMHTDPPDHTRYRKLVQPAFAPRLMRSLEATMRERAATLLDRVEPGAPFDVVPTLTAPFPLWMIADLLGIPDESWDRFLAWSDAVIPGANDLPEADNEAMRQEMHDFLLATALRRRGGDGDDLITGLANVEVDGDHLSDDELVMFLNQLLVAGNETSRNMLTGGLHAIASDPSQWDAMQRDRSLVPSAVEEMLRWTTPVIYFMRTATRDVDIGGVTVASGDPVVLLYVSANRDPDEFGPSAERFDVARSPNHHVAFGFGAHFCLGAALARLEGKVLLEELLDRYRAIEPTGEVERTASMVIAGIRHAPMAFVPA